MIKTVGRIVSRGEGNSGLFIPLNDGMAPGVYEVTDVMGVLTIKRVGDPALREDRFMGFDLETLFHLRDQCAVTLEEYQAAAKHRNDNAE